VESRGLVYFPDGRGDICILGKIVAASDDDARKLRASPPSKRVGCIEEVMLTSFAYATSNWGAVVGAWIEFRGAGR
jgi:hypothetical protein